MCVLGNVMTDNIWGLSLAVFLLMNDRYNHLQERQAFFLDLRIPPIDKWMMRGMMLIFILVWSFMFYWGYRYGLLLVERFPEAFE